MSNIIQCPSCGKQIRVPDSAAGEKGRCPACKSVFQIPDCPSQPEPHVMQYATAPAPPAKIEIANPIAIRRSSSLGIASMILGILGLLICWIPFIGLLGTPLSGLGLLLGVCGFLLAIFRKGAGIGLPIAGTMISGLALLIATASTGAAAEVASSFRDAHQRAQELTTRKAAVQKEAAIILISNDEPIAIGKTDIYLAEVRVDYVKVQSTFGGERTTKDRSLIIQLRIQNRTENQKIDYVSWAMSGWSSDSLDATLVDNFDNAYDQESLDIGAEGTGSIYPGKERLDILIFEPPIDSAETLFLTLPEYCVGGKTGKATTISIPRTMIQF